jgi:hypothetical protein
MSTWLGRLLGRSRAEDPAALGAFLGRHSAFVAQKTVLDYCRVKVGRDEPRVFGDPDFRAALDHCRWQTYAGAVADLCALAEAWLRPHAPAREPALAAAVAALGAAVLDGVAAPPAERESLDAAREGLVRHLLGQQLGPPRPPHRMPLLSEAPLMATLPIHPDQRIGETPAIKGALRFHLVAAQQEMERGFDAPRLAARLLDG